MAKVKSVIGLEVDSREIRAVEITRSSGTYSILACGKAPLPEGTIEEGFIRDPDRFNVALTELLQSGGFTGGTGLNGVDDAFFLGGSLSGLFGLGGGSLALAAAGGQRQCQRQSQQHGPDLLHVFHLNHPPNLSGGSARLLR